MAAMRPDKPPKPVPAKTKPDMPKAVPPPAKKAAVEPPKVNIFGDLGYMFSYKNPVILV